MATVFPATRALPTDPRDRAELDPWLHWQSCHLMPAMGVLRGFAETHVKALIATV